MGKCWNCNTEITLKEEDIKCNECGKIVNYQCHACHKWFSIYDEKTEVKRKECKICGFFVCEYCGSCGMYCEKDLWQTQIMKILAPEINYQTIPNLQNKINNLLSFIEEIKISHDQKQCPKKVPITYAKGRIKNSIARMKGYRIKSNSDLQKFNERVEEILSIPLGIQLTINQSREDGSYGQEYRDVFNYCICLGELKKQKIKKDFDGEEREIEIYRRINNGVCQFLDLKDLLLKICPKCKKEYPQDSLIEYCDCYVYQKGKKQGQNPKLKLKLSNKDTCQLNRSLFKKNA